VISDADLTKQAWLAGTLEDMGERMHAWSRLSDMLRERLTKEDFEKWLLHRSNNATGRENINFGLTLLGLPAIRWPRDRRTVADYTKAFLALLFLLAVLALYLSPVLRALLGLAGPDWACYFLGGPNCDGR
jgi:hypothetical protein